MDYDHSASQNRRQSHQPKSVSQQHEMLSRKTYRSIPNSYDRSICMIKTTSNQIPSL